MAVARQEGRQRPPLAFAYLQQVQPQVQPLPGHAVPQVQVACPARISGLFMASMVGGVRRYKGPGTPASGRYILIGKVCISAPPGPAGSAADPWP